MKNANSILILVHFNSIFKCSLRHYYYTGNYVLAQTYGVSCAKTEVKAIEIVKI